MVSVQSPLTPPALALSDRTLRALDEAGHPAKSQSTRLEWSMDSHDAVLTTSKKGRLFFASSSFKRIRHCVIINLK